jgi:hypothetical protein
VTDDAEELVTVAEAARALGIDARQVRRYAAGLGHSDRTPAGQSPVRVRVSAVAQARDSRTNRGRSEPPPGRTPAGQDSDIVTVLRAEVDELRGQLRRMEERYDAERAAREQADGEYRRLLLRAMPAIPAAPDDTPEEPAPRAWWPFRRGKGT